MFTLEKPRYLLALKDKQHELNKILKYCY